MKYNAISQYQPFLFIKLATPFHFVRLSKMNTLNKSLCAALLAVVATSSFAAETQVVETTKDYSVSLCIDHKALFIFIMFFFSCFFLYRTKDQLRT